MKECPQKYHRVGCCGKQSQDRGGGGSREGAMGGGGGCGAGGRSQGEDERVRINTYHHLGNKPTRRLINKLAKINYT